eukprot:g42263.t1
MCAQESELILQRFGPAARCENKEKNHMVPYLETVKAIREGKGRKQMKGLTHPGIRKVLKPLAVSIGNSGILPPLPFFASSSSSSSSSPSFLPCSSAPASASASASVAATGKAIKKEIIEIDTSDKKSSKAAVKKRKMKSQKESEDTLELTCKICTYVVNPPYFLVCELCSAKQNQDQLQADDSDPTTTTTTTTLHNENANDDTKSSDEDSDSDSDSDSAAAAASINTAKLLSRDVEAGEELSGEETFIAFEWVDYDNNKQVKRESKKKVKRFSLGKVVKVEVNPVDPNLESTVLVHVWDHPAGSNQYTGQYRLAWLHGEKRKQSMNDPSSVSGRGI